MRRNLCFNVGVLAFYLAVPVVARPFSYLHVPSDTTLESPVTQDFAIIGYSGGQYNEDTLAREFTGPSSPTVTIADGAAIPAAEVFNSSVVNATGGAWNVDLYDHSTLNVLGGNNGVGASVLSFESSTVNIFNGTMFGIYGQGQRVNVYGGTINTLESNSNTTYLGDNLGSCVTEVTGGTFIAGGNLTAFNDGVINLRGGVIHSDFLRAAEGATLNIYGSNLAAHLVNSSGANGYSIYMLSGSLADGNPIDGIEMRIRNDGVTYGHSTFNLIVTPEPGSAVAMFLIGSLARRPRRNTSAPL